MRDKENNSGKGFRYFETVDFKVLEAEFFLSKVREAGYNVFETKCYVSAFVSATRTITYSLQAVLRPYKGFGEWYDLKRNALKNDSICKFFHTLRNVNQHIGDDLIDAGTVYNGVAMNFFVPNPDIPEVPACDVLTACEHYFIILLDIIFECYQIFGALIDARRYFTEENFAASDKTIKDALEELGYPRDWFDIDGLEPSVKWYLIEREIIGCEIDHLFQKYLNKSLY
jgi:hypothetical protein